MQPVLEPTIARIESALAFMNYVVEHYGERYAPVRDSLIVDLEAYQRRLPSPERSMPKRPRRPKDPIGLEPRCLTIADAAAYCGLTPSGFRHWVALGRLPAALPGTHRWDRKAIDFALDRLSGLPTGTASETGENDFDRWKRRYDAREAEARNPDPSLRGPPWRRVPK